MKLLLALCLALLASAAVPQTVNSVRETSYDFACCSDQGCTPAFASNHQQYTKAYEACVNATIVDGKTRWIDGGRYRISVTKPTPPSAPTPEPPKPPETTSVPISWTAPDKWDTGAALSAALTYRVESKTGGVWTTVATTSALSQLVPRTGCYRVVVRATRTEGDREIYSEGASNQVWVPTEAACQ